MISINLAVEELNRFRVVVISRKKEMKKHSFHLLLIEIQIQMKVHNFYQLLKI